MCSTKLCNSVNAADCSCCTKQPTSRTQLSGRKQATSKTALKLTLGSDWVLTVCLSAFGTTVTVRTTVTTMIALPSTCGRCVCHKACLARLACSVGRGFVSQIVKLAAASVDCCGMSFSGRIDDVFCYKLQVQIAGEHARLLD